MSDATRIVVVDTAHSPYARLKPVPLDAVTLADDFWAPRMRINQQVTLPGQYRHLEDTARLDNFRIAAGKMEGAFEGIFFNDSDVYKWLEAASWALAAGDDPALAQMVGAAITEIAAAQQPDGYLNTYFMFERAGDRWSNLRDLHELYCAGHLIQAAVANYRATGSDRLLQVACRLADAIDGVFGAEAAGKRGGAPGHEEIEMALVELARAAGEPRYLALAQFFVDARGQGHAGGDAYHQDHVPFRELDRMVGHAVRAVYLNAGAADLYAERGEATLRGVLDRLWQRMTERQMYVSGGIGSRYQGEAFGEDYELPNSRAYAETCAAIGSVMWNWRMLALEGDARYADVMETTLYNAVLVGLSLDGQSYFYQNPLADGGSHRRQPWFGCACCPPNIARTLASLPGYAYSLSVEGVWVHLYAEGEARLTLLDGREVGLVQHTRYPWDGTVTLDLQDGGTYSLYLRVPGWCTRGASLRVNGELFGGAIVPGTYVEVRRVWEPGDRVTLDLPMPVRRVACHPYVADNAGRVALMRGPLLYCLEQVDHADIDLRDLVLPAEALFATEFRAGLLGDVTVLCGDADCAAPDVGWAGRLYRHVEARSGVAITAIPYYAWANRAPGAMQVWLRTRGGSSRGAG